MTQNNKFGHRGRAKPVMKHKPKVKPKHSAATPAQTPAVSKSVPEGSPLRMPAPTIPASVFDTKLFAVTDATPLPLHSRDLVRETYETLFQSRLNILEQATVANPDALVEDLRSLALQYSMPIFEDKEALIHEHWIAGHICRVTYLDDLFATDDNPDFVLKRIRDSVRSLTARGDHARLFKSLGLEDVIAFETHLRDRYDEARRRLWGIENDAKVNDAILLFKSLPTAKDPGKSLLKLTRKIDELGESQARVFPNGVISREEFDALTAQTVADRLKADAEAHFRKQLDHGRMLFNSLAHPKSYRKGSGNIDDNLFKLSLVVSEDLKGDLSLLAPDRSEDVAAEIERRHIEVVEWTADDLLRALGKTVPPRKIAPVEPDPTERLTFLDCAQTLANDGIICTKEIKAYWDAAALDFPRDKPDERARATVIDALNVENRALNYLLVTHHFETSCYPYAFTRALTEPLVATFGGVEGLDAAAKRAGVSDTKWDEIKNWHASLPSFVVPVFLNLPLPSSADSVESFADVATEVAGEPAPAVAVPALSCEKGQSFVGPVGDEESRGHEPPFGQASDIFSGASVEIAGRSEENLVGAPSGHFARRGNWQDFLTDVDHKRGRLGDANTSQRPKQVIHLLLTLVMR